MENTALIALSRQGALRRQMGIVANNIANMNTTAFKGEKMMFVQHLVKSRGGERLMRERLAFVRDIATVRDTTEGSLEKTSNPLDIAIRGDGYLVVETDAGERFTRNGHLRLDETGQLVNKSGYPVLAVGDQPIFFAPEDTDINISRDGTISTNNGEIGRLKVVAFENPQTLEAAAAGLYTATEDPKEIDNPQVVQGMVESSNVEPIIELTRMMEVQRAYEGVKKLIEREDERIKKMLQQLAIRA